MTATTDITPRLPNSATPQVATRPAGALSCGACGKTVLPEFATPEKHSRDAKDPNGNSVIDRFGTIKVAYEFDTTRCTDCAARRARWGAARERLGVAVELLGYTGTPGTETLTAAGIDATDARNWPVAGLLWVDWVEAAADNLSPFADTRWAMNNNGGKSLKLDAITARVAKATTVPFGHITRPQADALREVQRSNRAKWSGAAPEMVIITAADAGHLVSRFADYICLTGCLSCGVRAMSAPAGTAPIDIWEGVHVPVSQFTRQIRRAGAQAGYVAGVVCDHCWTPMAERGIGLGEELASLVLPHEIFGDNGNDPDTYAPGAVAAALYVGRWLRAKILGQAEPVATAGQFGYLKPRGVWEILPVDPAHESRAAFHAEAAAQRNQAVIDAALSAEIDRRATEKAAEAEKRVTAKARKAVEIVHKAVQQTRREATSAKAVASAAISAAEHAQRGK